MPALIDDKLSYIPWGGDNQMPFDILDLIEKDVIDLWPLSWHSGERNFGHLPSLQC